MKKMIGVILAVVLALAMTVPVSAAVWTDQADYYPGSTVTIHGDNSNGAGYVPGETVTIDVIGPNGYTTSTTAIVGDDGSWSAQITLNSDDSAVGEYTYTATTESGISETGTFTDAPAKNINVFGSDGSQHQSLPAFQDLGNISKGTPLNCTVNVKVTGNPTSVTWSLDYATLDTQDNSTLSSLTTGLPATGTNTNSSMQVSASFSINTSSLTVGTTYAGHLYAQRTSGDTPVTSTDYYFKFTVAQPTTLALSISPSSIQVGSAGPVILTATLTRNDTNVGVVGATISFTVNGNTLSNTAITSTGGIATLNLDSSSLIAGSYDIQAFFAGQTISSIPYAASQSSIQTLSVTAASTNHAPTVSATYATVTVNEGSQATNSGPYADADSGDIVTVTASVGAITGDGAQSGTWSWTYTPPDGPDDSQTVTITATDNHGASNTTSFDLTVNNVAPTVIAPSDQTADEGSDTSFSLGSFSDPGVNDSPWELDVDWGDSSTHYTDNNIGTQGSLGSQSHTYADNGTYTVTVKVTDKDDDYGTATFDVTVANVAPTVGAITVAPDSPVIKINTAVSASANFTDPGILDTHTASWDWGDGNSAVAGTVTEQNGNGSVSDSHTYTAAGIYKITLTVTDKDGDSGSSTYEYVVVYDPNGGFVTGGGWINSPQGAYTTDPTLTGKATFGFVSKYVKGKTLPTGNTEFQFHAAGLNFSSTSYEWLVVSGTRAQYKGTGTINGAGNYGFMLSAIDGGKTGQDKFRIKIWDKDNGDAIVYDNQMGASDTADLTTVISGGSIVVQK